MNIIIEPRRRATLLHARFRKQITDEFGVVWRWSERLRCYRDPNGVQASRTGLCSLSLLHEEAEKWMENRYARRFRVSTRSTAKSSLINAHKSDNNRQSPSIIFTEREQGLKRGRAIP
jgi:hypothetical protein